MSYEEVLQLIGMPGVTVATNGIDSVVYKWTSDGGSFLGKFQGGKLLRKTVQSRPKTEEESDTSHVLTQEQYNDVKEGMTLEEVLDRLDVQARLVTDDSQQDVTIYKWTDDHGSSFTARFENGKLVRKTGFYVGPLEKPSPLEVSESEGEESAESMAETPETLAQEEEAEEGEEGPTETAAWDTGSPAVIAEEPSAPESSIREEVFEPIAEPVDDELVMADIDRGKYYGLNNIAAAIWLNLEKPITVEELCKRLCEQYEVSARQCSAETLAFLGELEARNLISVQ